VKIAFYYAYPHEAWDWNDEDLEMTGIGGVETALVLMARELAKRHTVTVFNSTSREGVYNGVGYRHRDGLDYRETWDAFISLRGLVPNHAAVRAGVKVYWSIEIDATLLDGSWDNVLPYVNAVFTISPYHSEILREHYPEVTPKLHETFLGVWTDDYREVGPKVPNKLIWCSCPLMGLEHLAPIFESVRRSVPEATLVITGDPALWGRTPDNPDPYWGTGPSNERYRDLFSEIPGVHFLGKVGRQQLIEQQKTSSLHVYPCTVPELFCLASMECQAAGTPTVATGLGALATTVADGRTGVLIATRPDQPGFHEEFARAVVELLTRPSLLAEMSRNARHRALSEFTYEQAAAEWERWISCRL